MDPTDSSFFDMPQPMTQGGSRRIIRFETQPVEMGGKSLEAGRPIYEDRDFVFIVNPGSRDERVAQIKEKKNDPEVMAFYARWKTTQEQPKDGTPLSMVPFLSPSQIKELQGMNILTLEHLAEIPDTVTQRMMGMVELRKKAKSYLDAAKDSAVVTRLESELASRDLDLAAKQKQIDDLCKRLEALEKDKAA